MAHDTEEPTNEDAALALSLVPASLVGVWVIAIGWHLFVPDRWVWYTIPAALTIVCLSFIPAVAAGAYVYEYLKHKFD